MVYHDISQEQLLLLITQAVQAELQKRSRQVPVGISVRHIHLTRDDVDKLFGYGYQLTPKKALSQPGQFACEECLDIIGPKGELKHVRILGPERSATQIELAQTDCRNIGIKAPVRSSGDTKGTPGVTLRGPNGTLTVPEGVMIADRHIHMTPAQAAAFGLADGDRVQVHPVREFALSDADVAINQCMKIMRRVHHGCLCPQDFVAKRASRADQGVQKHGNIGGILL